ncbi:PIG-L deacetylase family protein [Fibrobacterota bacterium]
MNILVIAAHPDDEVLGCGGTMAKYAKEGHDVYTLILGEGVTSRDEKRDKNKRKKELRELEKNAASANKALGVKDLILHNFPDNRFDTIAMLDIIKVIERVKSDIGPDMVFTHHHGDLNIDHQLTQKAVLTAFRPNSREKVIGIFAFEIPSSTEWSGPFAKSWFMPNYFVDISRTLGNKTSAMKKYKSEVRDYPHPRSLEAIQINAKAWGIKAGGIAAVEAFSVIRQIDGI